MKSADMSPERRAYALRLAANMPALIRAVIVGGERFECPPAPGLIPGGRKATEGGLAGTSLVTGGRAVAACFNRGFDRCLGFGSRTSSAIAKAASQPTIVHPSKTSIAITSGHRLGARQMAMMLGAA